MKKYIIILFAFISSFANAQFDFQQLCLDCAEQNGFYCGDDPANWTQYAPNGCVPNGTNNLFYLNDGWEDCVDGSDEDNAVPTIATDCAPPPPPPCDTVYVDVPVYIYETLFQTDTLYQTEYITQIVFDTIVEIEYETIFEEIFITDTLWMEGALDTMFIDIIEYVDVFIFDTIVETETVYIEFFTTDTIVEYIEIINTEYLDCDTGLPCISNIPELLNKYNINSVIYNINGQAIKEPEGLYIEDGKVKFLIK
tara:strand:- start:1023 stop:1781 length:759 start_codon:yes stop_codon:yes gene_type:complete